MGAVTRRNYGTNPGMSEERLIKKYANRRLYDASQSRHITIGDIRNMVVAGERVKVIEDKTNEDITRLILLQVIADQEQFGRPILSTALLESLIRFYGNSLQGFLSTYLEKSVETFMNQQEVVQTQLARMITSAPMATMSELTRQNLELWTRMQETMLAAFSPPAPPPPKANGTDTPEENTP
jgi:polyhydroxyalkanoate synthesis repressor PhaR